MRKKILIVTITVAAGMLAGCGRTEKTPAETETLSVSYDRETDSLEQWQEQLQTEGIDMPEKEAVRGVRICREGETLFAVSYEPRSYKSSYDSWSISVPYESWVSVDTEQLYNWFEQLEELALEPAESIPDDMRFSQKETSIFVAYYSGQTEDEAGQAEPDKAVLWQIGDADGEGHYYIKSGTQNQIWLADQKKIDDLFSVNPYDCVLKIANAVNIGTVSQVEADVQGETYCLELSEEGYRFNGKKMASEKAEELYTKCISIFLEGEKDPGEEKGKCILSLTYHRNTEDAPEIVESFWEYGDNSVLLSVNGTEFFVAEKAAVEELIQAFETAG